MKNLKNKSDFYGFQNVLYASDDEPLLNLDGQIDDNEEAWVEIKKSSLLDKLKSQKGSFIAILSALFLSLGSIFYKKAASMNGADNSIFRYIIQLVTMTCILVYKKIPVFGPREQRGLLVKRSFFGIFAVVFTNFAIQYIAPSDNLTLSHTNVIITAIIARIFLKEKLGLQHFLSLIFTLTGILLITKPTFIFRHDTPVHNNSSNSTIVQCQAERDYSKHGVYGRLIGVCFALIGACGSAAIHVIVKKLCMNKVYFGVTTLYGTFMGLPASIITSTVLILIGASHSNFTCEWKYLPYDFMYGIIGGTFAVLAHVTFNISLQFEDASKVAILRTIDVAFSFLLQFLILGINADYISGLGAVAILIGTLIILFYKMVKEKFNKKPSAKLELRR